MNLDRFSRGLQDRQELEPNIIEHCDGCDEPIVEGEDMCDWGSVMLHDEIDCITNYVRNNSVRKVQKMSYYDEDFYCEPSEFDQQVDEFKQSILVAVKVEFKDEMESLRKENKELQVVKENFEGIKKDYKNKERQLESERKELERNVRRERLSTLMKDFELIMYRATSRKETLPKCERCDETRKIHYKTPLGKDAHEQCECAKGKEVYIPEEYVCTTFQIDRDGKAMQLWYKMHEERNGDYGSYSSSDLAKEKYQEGMAYEELGWYHSTFFSTKEECQKYCDWLNIKKAE